MSTSILPTKLFIPQSAGVQIHRARLFEQLESGLKGVLTLVSAPAGYGKSTLISELAYRLHSSSAWLSLDINDNDPVRFWSYFIAALQRISFWDQPDTRSDLLDVLNSSTLSPSTNFLEDLISQVAKTPQKAILILDDFHLITENQILDGMLYLLENLSMGTSDFHLILLTRSDPPWPLARLRVRGQIHELRATDLRFRENEIQDFFSHSIGLALESREVRAIEKRTEGWIAGLQMAALSMKGHEDIEGFIRSFTGSHRFVMDYLLEEVLRQQPSEIQDFLLKTSILERITDELCYSILNDLYLGREQIEEAQHIAADRIKFILDHLEQNNLFLIALDEHREWYRYHHLFADLLQKQLQTQYPNLIPELHRRASNWYAQEGYLPDAIEHALKTEDLDFAAQTIEAHFLTLVQQGDITLTRYWLNSFPDEFIRTRPILCIAQVWVFAKYSTVERAEELLARAEGELLSRSSDSEDIDRMPPETRQLLSSQIALLQVVIARIRGDSIQQQQSLAISALDFTGQAGDTATRATLLFRLGLCYLDLGNHDQADRTFLKAIELGRSSGNAYAVHAASYGRMIIAKLRGKLHLIKKICNQNLNDKTLENRVQQPSSSLIGINLVMLGSVQYEWNELEKAENTLERGLESVHRVGISELIIKGQFALACVKIARGDFSVESNMRGFPDDIHPNLKPYAIALQARIWLMLAQQTSDHYYEQQARSWVDEQTLSLREQSTYDWEIQEKLIYARVLIWLYQKYMLSEHKIKLYESLDFILEQRNRVEELGWEGTLLEVDMVSALVFNTLGRCSDALAALECAMRVGETQGFVRIFTDEGEPMWDLIIQAVEAEIHKPYAMKLLAAFGDQPEGMQLHANVSPFEQLSERELEVLRLLRTQLSVPEIAEEIHLAPTTVRTHVQNIYRKLDVHGRIEAIQKSKELKLF